ncbi:LEA type 2 family protein [Spongiibacter taiwanensis]|uniref:LEA type 2 family protein n=1 Tax=Spongiibacter taiwanensis TaxID=1748242 RepID=UPI002036060D|nr:LEA type 2 family protein [Spongiibacter taiwanensis]USA41974.1 LEA type 2 family protein [Spongiibacter taiwanensis]
MKIVLSLFAALLLSACAALNPIEKPDVAITSINIGPSNGLQQQLLVGLQLDNPNDFALNLGRLRYSISLAGNSLAGGRFNEAVVLPANDRANIVVPVDVNLLNGLGLIRSIMSTTGDMEYKLSLTAAVANFGLGDITVNKVGNIGLGVPTAK